MNIWEILLLFFALQGFMTAFFLLTKRSTSKFANCLWGIFLLLFSLNIVYNILFWAYNDWRLTVSLNLVYLIPFSLYGPLFYLYINALVKNGTISWKKMLPHFAPTLLIIANFSYYFSLPVETKLVLEDEGGFGHSFLISPSAVYVVVSIIMLIYSFLTFKAVKDKFKQDPEMKLWLTITTGVFFLFGVSWVVYFILSRLGVLELSHDYIIAFFMVAQIGITTYFGFNYSEVFNGKALNKVFPLIKYQKSGLSKRVLNEYKEKLLIIMESNSLYLDSELKLTDLADELNVSRHHASQIINECFGMSFYEYINRYRVEEAEKLLTDEKASDLNITDIAFKAGFNNRMSFYNAFKKHVGITPSEYRNRSMAS
ncbi:helix-turn-helix domain-containing protein [Flagellimonas meishanensis]|uniref:helix-turn-helix domain-containing protein n=1 Tax=Flagellimonas meishanensis TaxID=2873264 RepID=UPI001CA6D3C6|nr:helix-turn-helix domain-containing protein [[Muricauda] meishanensis]